jgi:hypothetical protein
VYTEKLTKLIESKVAGAELETRARKDQSVKELKTFQAEAATLLKEKPGRAPRPR